MPVPQAAARDALRTAAHGCVRDATGTDDVDGVAPRWVVGARDTATMAAVLSACAAGELSVVVRGAGTKLGWGAPPRRCDVLVDTLADPVGDSGDTTLFSHAAGDLVVTASAGLGLADLQARLAPAGQRLAVDPARPGTVGGLVATGEAGPLRLLYGRVRDLVIGVTAVRADGVVAHAGGTVVKNVAGYDLGKLLTGSYGTLAAITEVTFRLHPVPAAQAWVTVPASSTADIRQRIQAAIHSQTVPAAVELDRPGPSAADVSVLLEGTSAGVAARAAALAGELGPDARVADTPPPWWGREPGSPAGAPVPVLLKATCPIGAIDALLEAVDAAAGAATGAHVRGSAGAGAVIVGLTCADMADPSRVAPVVQTLRAKVGELGGTVVLQTAPAAVKEAVDVWGPVPAMGLMHAIKRQFDPAARLAPGRFVGGI